MSRLKPQYLKSRMKRIIKLRKEENFDKKDFNAYMREKAVQAYKLQNKREAKNPLRHKSVIDLSSDDESNAEIRPQKARNKRLSASKTFRKVYKKDKTQLKPKVAGKWKHEDDEFPSCLNLNCR